MSEWWTYRLGSFLLFSPRTYFRLHELYNAAVWPAQLAGLALGIAVVVLACRARPVAERAVPLLLALAWLFVAWAYQYRHYATINWAATYFAGAFALQGGMFVVAALTHHRSVSFDGRRTARTRLGAALAVFGMLVQPALGVALGRNAAQSEYFGVAPDPTVVATLGVLLIARRARWFLWIVPLLWCAISGAFQVMMRLPDGWLLPLIGAAAALAAVTGSGRRPPEEERHVDA
jgi:hypothetical protein